VLDRVRLSSHDRNAISIAAEMALLTRKRIPPAAHQPRARDLTRVNACFI